MSLFDVPLAPPTQPDPNFVAQDPEPGFFEGQMDQAEAIYRSSAVPTLARAYGVAKDTYLSGSPTLTPEEATEKYGMGGILTFDKPISDVAAQMIMQNKKEELTVNELAAQGTQGPLRKSTGFLTGVLTSLLDPINTASMFMPVVGEARFAQLLKATGGSTIKATLAKGAIEGAVGNAVIEPFMSVPANYLKEDYSWVDSAHTIAFGAVLGGPMHLGVSAMDPAFRATVKNERLSRAEAVKLKITETEAAMDTITPEQQATLSRAAAADLINDTQGSAAKIVQATAEPEDLATAIQKAHEKQLRKIEERKVALQSTFVQKADEAVWSGDDKAKHAQLMDKQLEAKKQEVKSKKIQKMTVSKEYVTLTENIDEFNMRIEQFEDALKTVEAKYKEVHGNLDPVDTPDFRLVQDIRDRLQKTTDARDRAVESLEATEKKVAAPKEDLADHPWMIKFEATKTLDEARAVEAEVRGIRTKQAGKLLKEIESRIETRFQEEIVARTLAKEKRAAIHADPVYTARRLEITKNKEKAIKELKKQDLNVVILKERVALVNKIAEEHYAKLLKEFTDDASDIFADAAARGQEVRGQLEPELTNMREDADLEETIQTMADKDNPEDSLGFTSEERLWYDEDAGHAGRVMHENAALEAGTDCFLKNFDDEII